MKERKNIVLLLGAVLSALPLVSYIIGSVGKIDFNLIVMLYKSVPNIRRMLFLIIVNSLLLISVTILVVMQFRRNKRQNSNHIIPMLGIAVSCICLVLNILSFLTDIPSILLYNSLDLAFVRYFLNVLLMNFIMPGIVGNIFMIIGYVRSLPKRK